MTRHRPVALVTGGSRGIGKAIALRLASAGYDVGFSYLEACGAADEVRETAASLGGRAVPLRGDLADPDAVAELFAATEDALGPLDALVLNAGHVSRATLVHQALDDFALAVAINTQSALLAFQQASARMREGGSVVALSSRLVAVPTPDVGVYTATKAALEQLCRVAALELSARKIRVNVVRAGLTDTRGHGLAPDQVQAIVHRTPLGRLGQPEDVAGVVEFLLSDAARWVTGQTLTASGGL